MKKILLFLSAALLPGQVAPPASAVFDQDAVHEIRLTFKNADWYEQLTADYAAARDNTPYREASIVWGQYKFDVVGVRFKGNSSYNGATTKKKPFRIKLNEFVKGQKIEGMASFGLSNGWSDPSFIREKAYYEMAAKTVLSSSRSNFAALYVNNEYWGLYILGEIVNGDFLDNHYVKADRGGNLYKASDPGANLAYLGENPTAYQPFFSKESNEEANDWTDLIELARIFEQTPSADLPGKLANLVDVDSFLTALALDNLTVNTDSYVGMAQNYYLYRRASDNKWVWIPWDPSLAFGALSQGSSPDLTLEWTQTGGIGAGGLPGGGGAGGPGGGGGRPLATKLWEIPQYKQRYREIYQRLVDQLFVPSQIIGRMNSLRDMIRPWVEKDTQKLVTMAQFEAAMKGGAPTDPGTPAGPGGPGGGLGGGLSAPALEPFIEARAISVKAQLAGRPSPSLTATPTSLIFAQVSGASTSGSQEFGVSLPQGSAATTFSAATSTPWLALTGATGAVPGKIGVRVTAPALATGTHTGSISISAPGTTNSPLAVPVSLIVTAGPSVVASPASLTFSNFGGGGLQPVPGAPAGLTQTVQILSTAGSSPFAVAVSESTCGNFLSVTPNTGTTPATVTVTASAPNASGSCTARLNVTSSGLASAAIPVTFNATTGPGGGPGGGFPGLPAITAIVNSASYASGGLAPGTIVTIFGTNLGAQTLTNGTFANGQMSTTVGGMQFTFDGTPAPILYTRSDQAAVVVPFEIAGKSQVDVRAAMSQGGFPGQIPGGGQLPGGLQMTVAAVSPGIYTASAAGTGQAAVVNENGTVNSANAAALRGSTVAIYLTGAGAVMPAARSGTLGTAEHRITAPVTVSIGGQEARVTYAGAAPSALQGLYQINAVVPSNVNTGSVPLQVSIGGISSQTGVLMLVQ
jgi:uncharacterized protein (TIGR03437 family)